MLMSFPLSVFARWSERRLAAEGKTYAMIETRDLQKNFGSLQVLRGVTLSVAEGEVAAIIGPSGGGKSTFLRCLNGLERFEAGQVRIGQHTLTAGKSRSHCPRDRSRRAASNWAWCSSSSICSRISPCWAT